MSALWVRLLALAGAVTLAVFLGPLAILGFLALSVAAGFFWLWIRDGQEHGHVPGCACPDCPQVPGGRHRRPGEWT